MRKGPKISTIKCLSYWIGGQKPKEGTFFANAKLRQSLNSFSVEDGCGRSDDDDDCRDVSGLEEWRDGGSYLLPSM